MNNLLPHEIELIGQWTSRRGRPYADETCQRIEWLVKNRLRRIAVDASGWETLYIDPADGRLWEHTYPLSEMHGGGPPALLLITPQAAKDKYGKP